MKISVTNMTPILMLVSLFAENSCLADNSIHRDDLGRSVKLTILVDKVMQPQAKWVTKEWMIENAAKAGFNVFSPRRGHDNIAEVERVTKWCARYGIYHMPWMRGSLAAPAGSAADGKRLVWASGTEQPLWSPNSDEFWDWTKKYIIEYAKISAKNKHLIGIFLDYENYAIGKEGNLYDLSYDRFILQKFAKSVGAKMPKIESSKRKSWLKARNLHNAFASFQINGWRERSRALREAVDQIDPSFQFSIYPAPGTLFIRKSVYLEWATTKAPLILADSSTYGRSSRILPEKEELIVNRQKLLTNRQIPQNASIPFIYAGGIDPIVPGADPEFSGKNAVMISQVTDGYWVFYEGPTYTKQNHADYWKWFTWANKSITQNQFDSQFEPRQTPEDWLFNQSNKSPRLLPPKVNGTFTKYSSVMLRGENFLLLACKTGQPVKVKLRNHPVGHYESPLIWDIHNSHLAKVASNSIPYKKTGVATFTPKTNAIYLLRISAGSVAYSVVSSNVPLGLLASEGLGIIDGAKRLYFNVPASLKQFSLSFAGTDTETVRLNVFDSLGNQVTSGQTTLKKAKAQISVKTKRKVDEIWSLEITHANEGVLEDSKITLDKKLPPTLSLTPEQVFGVVESEEKLTH